MTLVLNVGHVSQKLVADPYIFGSQVPNQHLARLDTQCSSKSAVWLKVSSFESIQPCWVISQLEVLTQMSTTACSWISSKVHQLDITDTFDTLVMLSEICGHRRTRSFTGIPATLWLSPRRGCSQWLTQDILRCLCPYASWPDPEGVHWDVKTGGHDMTRKCEINGTSSGVMQLVWSQTEPCWSRAERPKEVDNFLEQYPLMNTDKPQPEGVELVDCACPVHR